MGCVSSTPALPPSPPEERERSDEIDEQIKKDHMASKDQLKLLLLGAGESGKSTILKQMKLFHAGGFTQEERLQHREIVFGNTIQSMKIVLQAVEDLGLSILPQNIPHAELVRGLAANIVATHLPRNICVAIEALRMDPGVEEAVGRSNEYQLNDSATYFFEAVQRMSEPEYIPTDLDILRSRVKTTGIAELLFKVENTEYKVFDVGGQRSERRKWIHCFENLDAVIFMVSLSEYDQVLREDDSVNRMQESLVLFDSICNSPWFRKTNMILFLNKMDLLADKVTRSPLNQYLTDYDGPNDYESAVTYFRKAFVRCNRAKDKQIYTHVTCATDSRQIKFVLLAMHDILIKNNLKTTGFL